MHIRKSGLIIMTDGMPGSGPPPSSEVLGTPPDPKHCRCRVCGNYFRSIYNIPEIICEKCKAKAVEKDKRAGELANGNLPEGVHRVTKHTEALTGMAPRRKVHGEFNDRELEKRQKEKGA